MGRSGRQLAILAVTIGAALACASPAGAASTPSFTNSKVLGAPGGWPWNEPRISQGPDGRLWVSSIGEDTGGPAGNGTFNVWSSGDNGVTWKVAPTAPSGQVLASPDTDVVTMPNGRVIGTELDQGTGVNFPTWFTDDGGRTWTQSQGSNQLADQDRQWLAVGPEPGTPKQQDVYLLFHNLASGNAQHNMFVAKSTDGGATFGVPVPITLPGSDAYTDLQCADSGGPSAIFVNQQNGTVYAEFTTRASPTPAGDFGGCAPLASGQPLEFNIVAGTRVWMAQSTNGGQTWTNSLAVDDASTGQIVSMQVASGGLDTAGNVYVAYPESPLGVQYPDYSGAGVKFKWAAPRSDGNMKWSDGHTLIPAVKGSPGHVLVHMAVGDPGQLEAFYWEGVPQQGKDPLWYTAASQTLDGLSSNPTVASTRVSQVPTDIGTASTLMGACTNEGPVSGIVNGLACGRSPDVWGAIVLHNCMPAAVWPAVDNKDVSGNNPGTWVSTQTGGESLCGAHPGAAPALPAAATAGRPAGGCPDRTPPVSRFVRRQTKRTRGGFKFGGTSKDKGCKSANNVQVAGKVAHVDISIAKVRGKGVGKNCRFLTPKGKLTGFRNCRRPVLLRAHGTSHWRFTVKGALAAGHYRAVVRGVDAAKNKERPHKGRNITYFTVK